MGDGKSACPIVEDALGSLKAFNKTENGHFRSRAFPSAEALARISCTRVVVSMALNFASAVVATRRCPFCIRAVLLVTMG